MIHTIETRNTVTAPIGSDSFCAQFNYGLVPHQIITRNFEKAHPQAERIDSDFKWEGETVRRIARYRLNKKAGE